MLDFLMDNISTVIVVAVLIVLIVLCIIGAVKSRSKCCGNCHGCNYNDNCRNKK